MLTGKVPRRQIFATRLVNMNSFNRKCISIVLMTSVMSCCVQVFGAAIQENEDTLADVVLLTRAKYVRHVRHVPVLRHGNKISEPITLPSMKDSADWEEDLLRNNDTNNSAEINFSEEEDDRKGPWTRMPASTIAQSAQVRNHSTVGVVSSQLETNSSYLNMQIAAASDSSETPSQSKAQRGIPVENAEAGAVFIDEEKDKAFDENESEGSSKLWIYSNAICILLVVGVSIFLIYYPKKDRRKTCKDSSESSSSTSSASSTA